MIERKQGLFGSNKEFRAAVMGKIETDLGVTTASAATMYNAAKSEAEKADTTVVLGRDPKKVKIVVEGATRGRPAGSKNKVVVADATATTEEGSGYAVPAVDATVQEIAIDAPQEAVAA